MGNILNILITYSQAIAVGSFLIAGISMLLLKQYHYGFTNMLYFLLNFVIFYGGKIFK